MLTEFGVISKFTGAEVLIGDELLGTEHPVAKEQHEDGGTQHHSDDEV